MVRTWEELTFGLLVAALAYGPLQAQDTLHRNPDPPRWVALSDSAGRVIGLREDQRQGWKDRSAKWDKQYKALGKNPEHQGTYIKLHNAREFDLMRFLTGDQYDRWKALNKQSIHLFGTKNPPGTNMPPDR